MALNANEAIAYNLDTLSISTATGVIITKSGHEIDCRNASKITGMQVDYAQPSDTTIGFLFKTSDNSNWFKLTSTGAAQTVTTSTPIYETIIENGNTVNELKALTNIPAFLNKKVLVAIALGSYNISNAAPKVRLKIKAQTTTQQLQMTETSPFYELGEDGQIDLIVYDQAISGSGSLLVTGQIRDESGNLTDWQKVQDLTGQKATAIRIKAEYAVKEPGIDSVTLKDVGIRYKEDVAIVSGAGDGDIISWTQNWYMNVRHCRMLLHHSRLKDSRISCYVCFRKRPKMIRSEHICIGTGQKATYQLGHADGVKYDTVKLYYDNVLISSGFDVNTEVGRITFTAPEGVIVTCDYEYGWDVEEWQEMQISMENELENYDVTEFRYSRPDDDIEKSVCAVRIALTTTTGHVTNESIGTGTGLMRTYKLSHKVKDGEIEIYDNGRVMSKKSYSVNNEETQLVKIAATKGHVLTASYEWVSETPSVYLFAAVFAA